MNWLHSRHFWLDAGVAPLRFTVWTDVEQVRALASLLLSVRQQSTKRQSALHNYGFAGSVFALLIESFSRRTQMSRFKKRELSIFPIKVVLNCRAANKSIHQSRWLCGAAVTFVCHGNCINNNSNRQQTHYLRLSALSVLWQMRCKL